ncbi:MAG: RNA polymerase sigma factor [Acidobacteriota bacterium]
MEAVLPLSMIADASDEASLVRRAQQGDAPAFELLYRRNVGRVHALCLRMAPTRARAEELTQEAFLRAWEKLGSFHGHSKFSSWLHRVAVNVIISDQRSRRQDHERLADAEKMSSDGLHAVTSHPGQRRDIESAIASLPLGARTVFVLHDIEGFHHEEIGNLTGTSAGNSKAQLHRARRLLREVLR